MTETGADGTHTNCAGPLEDDLHRVLHYEPGDRTEALERFMRGFHDSARSLAQTQTVLDGYRRLATMADGIMEAVGVPQSRRDTLSEERSAFERLASSSGRQHRRRLVAESVDNYLSYLAEIAAMVMRARPETLRGNAEVRVIDVLSQSTMEEFVDWLAEREVTRLTMRGLPELSDHFEKKFGLPVTATAAHGDLLRCATLVRNLFTHRRGIIDRRFQEAMRSFEEWPCGELGELWEVPDGFAEQVLVAAVDSAALLDERAAQKFGLETTMAPHGAGCWGCAVQ